MGKAYDEIMEQVEVTEEMQARILSNIRTQKIHREKKILRYRKPLAYAAAGLLLIMVGVSYLPKVQKNGPETESEQFFVGNGIEECSSIETLSGKVGFLVEELSGLPFTVDHTEYLSYWGDMAEIDYQGADNEYAEVRILEADGFSVTVKGENGTYRLAIWQRGGYSYSLSLEKGADAATFLKIAEENQ